MTLLRFSAFAEFVAKVTVLDLSFACEESEPVSVLPELPETDFSLLFTTFEAPLPELEELSEPDTFDVVEVPPEFEAVFVPADLDVLEVPAVFDVFDVPTDA